MKRPLIITTLIAAAMAALASAGGVRIGDGFAGAVSALPPDLRALPARDFSIANSGGNRYLRLSTTSWNGGTGPLHVVAGETDPANDTQVVYQRVYNDDGSYQQYQAGRFVWHEEHAHTHFDDYATYTLDPFVAPGASQRASTKTTFCIIDTDKVNLSLPGAPSNAQYQFCNAQAQGLSVGWGDTYTWNLAGQEIDITGLPDGDYYVTVQVDPKRRIIESNEANNSSTIAIRIAGPNVSILTGVPSPTPTSTATSTPTPTPIPSDADGDGVADGVDNCPAVANAGQQNTDASNGAHTPVPWSGTDGLGDACDADDDGDGYTDAVESAFGEDALRYCDVMRADVVSGLSASSTVNAADLGRVASRFGTGIDPLLRENQDGNTAINASDLGLVAALFNRRVSGCS